MNKKILISVLTMLLFLSLSACRDKTVKTKEETNMVNPFKEAATLEEMQENCEVNFDSLPETIAGRYVADSYRYSESLGLAEVICVDLQAEDDTLVLRKARYTRNEDGTRADISGDYNRYENYAIVDGIDFAYEYGGNKGRVNLLHWDDGIYMYAALINPGTDRGIDPQGAVEIVRTVK